MTLFNENGEEVHLYHVEGTVECYVLATDERSAQLHGWDALRTELDLEQCLAYEVKPEKPWVEPAWRNSIPYGDRLPDLPDATVLQVLSEIEARRPDPRQAPLPLAHPLGPDDPSMRLGCPFGCGEFDVRALALPFMTGEEAHREIACPKCRRIAWSVDRDERRRGTFILTPAKVSSAGATVTEVHHA